MVIGSDHWSLYLEFYPVTQWVTYSISPVPTQQNHTYIKHLVQEETLHGYTNLVTLFQMYDAVCSSAATLLRSRSRTWLQLGRSQVSLIAVNPFSAREGVLVVTHPRTWPFESCYLRRASASGVESGRFSSQQIIE